MKYGDEHLDSIIKGLEREYRPEIIAVITQLRAELAEAKRENEAKHADFLLLHEQHCRMSADIERKRARIAALKLKDSCPAFPCGEANCGACSWDHCVNEALAILDDKETPHA